MTDGHDTIGVRTEPRPDRFVGGRSSLGSGNRGLLLTVPTVLCLSAVGSPTRAQAPSDAETGPPPALVAQALDSLVDAAVADGFSGQVLVVSGGETLLHRGYGPADPGTGTRVDTATVFAIGSVTKRFTRVAILKLEEAGRLSTSDPISRWLDGLPEDKQGITVGQLLDMESGLGEYHDDSGDHQPMRRDEALGRIAAQELRFEPGSDRAYSNSGYTLLAAIVEEASGRSFERYVREEILDPTSMRRTGFHGDSLWADDEVARGYGMRTFGENAPHRWPATTWALKGAGGMVAPAADLLRFIRGLRAGEIVGDAALGQLYPEDRGDLVYAGGDDFGFVTVVMELSRGEHVVIVSTNHGFDYQWLPEALAARVRGEPLADREAPGPGRTDAVQRLPDSPRGRAAGWLLSALEDGSDAALRTLVETRFAPAMRDAFPMEEHLDVLGRLARQVATEGTRGVRPEAEYSFVLTLGGGGAVTVDIGRAPPHLIEGIRIGGAP